MRTIHYWANTQVAARWLRVNYLHHCHQKDYYEAEELLQQASDEAEATIDLIVDSQDLAPWLSSLWTC